MLRLARYKFKRTPSVEDLQQLTNTALYAIWRPNDTYHANVKMECLLSMTETTMKMVRSIMFSKKRMTGTLVLSPVLFTVQSLGNQSMRLRRQRPLFGAY